MNKAGNIGILLAGIGFLLWGVSAVVDSHVHWSEVAYDRQLIQEDIDRMDSLLKQ